MRDGFDPVLTGAIATLVTALLAPLLDGGPLIGVMAANRSRFARYPW